MPCDYLDSGEEMIKSLRKAYDEVTNMVKNGMIDKSYEKVGEELEKRTSSDQLFNVAICTYVIVNDIDFQKAKKKFSDIVYNTRYATWEAVRIHFRTGNPLVLSGKNQIKQIDK